MPGSVLARFSGQSGNVVNFLIAKSLREPVITKAASIISLIFTNAITMLLYLLVIQDMSSRVDYSRTIGFDPSVAYSPLTYVLSAVGRGTYIPGLLTFDWSQFFLIVLILIDGSFALENLRRRKSRDSG